MFIKLSCIMNIKDMNYLPKFERWYHRYHLPETFAFFGPWITNYKNWRAVPYCPKASFTPEDGKRIGYYNYRVAEISCSDDNLMTYSKGHTAMTYTPEILEGFMGEMPDDGTPYATNWIGTPNGAHPTAHCYIPCIPTEDFMGMDLTTDGKAPIRWYIAHKYPEGVSVEEGEKWFLEVFAKEVMKQPGLLRFFSSRAVEMPKSYMLQQVPDGSQYPFQRVTELWYEDLASWRNAVIDSPMQYTKPSWAKYDQFPFLEPYTDFVSTFILERPDFTAKDVHPIY